MCRVFYTYYMNGRLIIIIAHLLLLLSTILLCVEQCEGHICYYSTLIFPNAGMYVGEEEGVRGEECGEEGGGDETRAYSELGFFESQESPGEGDDGVKRKTITSATSLVKV